MVEVAYDGKPYEVKFLHEPKNGSRGEKTVAYIQLDSGYVKMGTSERSPMDRYDLELAKKVALGRLLKKVQQE